MCRLQTVMNMNLDSCSASVVDRFLPGRIASLTRNELLRFGHQMKAVQNAMSDHPCCRALLVVGVFEMENSAFPKVPYNLR